MEKTCILLYSLMLSGLGFNALSQPLASIAPDSLLASINICKSSSTDSFAVINSGTSDLIYSVRTGIGTNFDSTSTKKYLTSNATTNHIFQNTGLESDTLHLTITINGDYDEANEFTDLYIEGTYITTINDGDVANGTDIIATYTYYGPTFSNWVSDGELVITLVNSSNVGSYVGTELHQVQARLTGAEWLSSPATTDTVAAGDTSWVPVLFDASVLGSGIYTSSILVNTNDGSNPQFFVDATLNVSGYPVIALSDSCLAFDTTLQDASSIKEIMLYNNGCDPLIISNITTTSTEFTADTTAFSIEPGDSMMVTIIFTPSTVGTFSDTLNIINNASDTLICLNGVSIDKPVLSFLPASFNVTMNGCNDSLNQSFTVYNNGSGDLTFYIDTLNYMAEFDGSGEYIQVPNVTLPSSYTLEAWAKFPLPNTGSWRTLWQTHSNRHHVIVRSDGSLGVYNFGFYNSGYDADVLSAGWHHIAAVVSGGQTNFYIDGNLVGTSNTALTTDIIYLGNYVGGGQQFGRADDFRIWDHARTQSQIIQYMDQSVSSDNSGLLAYWNFDDNTLTDLSGNGHNGTLVNGASLVLDNSPVANWIEFNNASGTILNNDSSIVSLTFRANGLTSGTYSSEFYIFSNDPLVPTDTIPVELTLNGQAEMTLSDSCLTMDTITAFTVSTDTIWISNPGCDTLNVTNLSANTSEFTADRSSFELAPGENSFFIISFTPTSAGNFTDTMAITSDLSDTMICLSATAIGAPVIATDPDSMNVSLSGCDDSLSRSLTVYNNGNTPLIFTLSDNQILDAPCEPVTTGNCCGMGIHNFSLNTISNSTGDGSESYQDYSDSVFTVLYTGNSYVINVETSTSYQESVRVWIDYNNDGFFDHPGEMVFESLNTTQFHSDTIIIPDSAVSQTQLRLRVGSEYRWEPAPLPCNNLRYGQFEDYAVIIGRDTVTSGDSVLVNLPFTAAGLNSGNYNYNYTLYTNDPLNNPLLLPVELTLDGSAEIALSENCLDMDSVMEFRTTNRSIMISNPGCDTLLVSDITNSLPEFSVDTSSFTIYPGDNFTVNVTFSPSNTGTYIDTLQILNNDFDTTICLSGNSFARPEMQVSPDTVNVTINSCSDTTISLFKIFNRGNSNLLTSFSGDLAFDSTSTQFYSISGEATDHIFSDLGQSDSVYLAIKMSGDFSSSFEYADLYIDGSYILRVEDGDVADGTEIVVNYTFGGNQATNWLSDGEITVRVDNSSSVSGSVSDRLHQVRLQLGGVSWMQVDSLMDTVPGNDSSTVPLTFNSAGLVNGVYNGKVIINGNDPLNTSDTVFTSLTVNGIPIYDFVSTACMDLDSIMEYTSNTDTFIIYNSGCDTLRMSSISTVTSEFTVDTTAGIIAPYDTGMIAVTFTPASTGTFNDTLTIVSNLPDTTICLTGKAYARPVINIDPLSFNISSTGCNDTITDSLTIYNTGGNILHTIVSGVEGNNYDSSSLIIFTGSGTSTSHNFNSIKQSDTLQIIVRINGDYDSGIEFAELYVEGIYIDTITDNNVSNGTDIIQVFTFTGQQAFNWLSDGNINVTIDNSPDVDAFVGTEEHEVNISTGGVPWLKTSSISDTTNVSDSTTIFFSFISTGFSSGNYYATLNLYSNDPLNSPVTIPVDFTVNGTPQMTLSDYCLAMDTIIEFTTIPDSFMVFNESCDTLFIDSIINNLSVYTYNNPTIIEPFDSSLVTVSFNPISTGSFNDTIRLYTNDFDTMICLSGYGFGKPDVFVSPDTLNASLNSCDDTVSIPLSVYNNGVSDLTYNIDAGAGNSPLPAQCTPVTTSYCCNMGIYAVWLNSINHATNNGIESYQDYSDSVSTLLDPDQTYSLRVETGPTYNERVRAWIDFNNDGQLDSTEMVMDTLNTLPSLFHRTDISIPSSAIHNTPLRMRIGSDYEFAPAFGPCDNLSNGQFEDFSVVIANVTAPEDTIPSGDSSVINITFRSTGLQAGQYISNLVINSNDPQSPEVTVPSIFNISGNPLVSLSANCIDLDSMAVGGSTTDTVWIYNTGCDTLQISSLSNNSSSVFSASVSNMMIAPLDSAAINIIFTPGADSTYLDTLQVFNNDQDTTICLSGTGIGSAVLDISPDSMDITLACGDTTTSVLTIYNSGVSPLIFTITDSINWATISSNSDTLNVGDSAEIKITVSSAGLGVGTYSDSLEINSNDIGNPQLFFMIDLNIISPLGAPATADQSACEGDTIPSLTASGTNIRWYSDSLLTLLAGSGNIFASGDTAPGVYTYYVTQTDTVTGCESPKSSVTLTISSASNAAVSVSASIDSICVGDSVVLTLNGGSLGAGASWQWYTSSCGGIPAGSDTSITITPSVTTTYSVRAEGVCDTTICQSITITVSSSAPQLTATDTTICEGDPTPVLIATGSNVQWYSDAALSFMVNTGDTFNTGIITSGTYNFYVTQTVGGCQSPADTSTLVIVSGSSAPASVTASSDTVCNGTSALLSVSGGILGDGASWEWFTGSCGGTPAGSGGSVLVTPSATTTYLVRAESACDTTICASTTVVVNTSSPAPATSDTTVCENQAIPPLTATGSNIRWYADAALNSLLFSGNTFNTGNTLPGIYTYYVTQTTGGCESPAATATLTIDSVSAAASSVNISNDTICTGGSVTLSVTGGSLGTDAAWIWHKDSCNGPVSGTGSVLVVNPSSSAIYFVRAEGKCDTTACASATVTVITTPPLAPLTSDTAVCDNDSIPSLIAEGNNVRWYADSLLTSLAGTGNVFNTGKAEAGSYTYYATQSNNGCESPAAAATLTINPTPLISAIAIPSILTEGDTAVLKAFNADSYSWTPATGLSSTTGASVLAFPAATQTYKITGVDPAGCSDTASLTVTVVPATGIENIKAANFLLYPNPNNGRLNVEFIKSYEGELSVVNILGEIIYKDNISNDQQKTAINLKGVAPGIYYVRLATDEGMVYKRFVVQK